MAGTGQGAVTVCQECERQELIAKMARETGKRMCTALGISTDMDNEALVRACERLRVAHDEAQESALDNLGRFLCAAKSCEEIGKERDALRAELESERKESVDWRNVEATTLALDNIFLRERAGQVKCNAGHVSDRALWDCPVCVKAMRARLALAERVVKAAQELNPWFVLNPWCLATHKHIPPGLIELKEALAAWEEAHG